MADGPHHSIGEVLSLLKEEHADVTISKIRFLESQGLIDPERTPSGYRKFYQHDVDRLRWILTQQRDHFLPLKVIKRRLAEEGFDPVAEIGERPVSSPLPEPLLFAQRPDGDGAEAPESAAPTSATASSLGSVSLTAADLAEAAGVDLGMIGELEKLGLIEAVADQNGSVFDHEALLVTKAAVAFRDAGMEARHLRMYKVAADREAGLLLQLRAAALAKGGSATADAKVELARLVAAGETIHRSLLRGTLGVGLET